MEQNDGRAGTPSAPAGEAPAAGTAPGSEPAGAEPADAQPAGAQPTRPEPAVAEPAGAQPADAQPADAQPTRPEPAGAEPADARPTRAQPADAEPADAQPAGAEPADAQPAAAPPADGETVEVNAGVNAGQHDGGEANPGATVPLAAPASPADPVPEAGAGAGTAVVPGPQTVSVPAPQNASGQQPPAAQQPQYEPVQHPQQAPYPPSGWPPGQGATVVIPRQPGPPRSAWAAALLNLTGLALGYAYLQRWWRTGLHLAGTAALVLIAFLTDPASTPWLWRVIAVGWVAWMVVDAVLLARRSPTPVRRESLVPMIAGVVAVALVVAGCVGYGIAERSTFATASDAQGRADCKAAVPGFDAVTGFYKLTLSGDLQDAVTRRGECRAFTVATDAEAKGDTAAAADAYEAFLRDHAGSVLRGAAQENLAQLYLRRATDAGQSLRTLTGDARVTTARSGFDALLRIKQDLGATKAAAQVPQVLQQLATAAESQFAAQQFCEALPMLGYEITLPVAAVGDIVATANTHRAQALLGCGINQFRGGQFAAATTQLQQLVDAYPSDPGVPQAKAALIAAEIAGQTPDPIPLPAPLDRPGQLRVTFYNITSTPKVVKLTGTSAGQVALPACPDCPATHDDTAECPDPANKPAASLQVDPGLYHLLLGNGRTVKTLTPKEGDEYCVYTIPQEGLPAPR